MHYVKLYEVQGKSLQHIGWGNETGRTTDPQPLDEKQLQGFLLLYCQKQWRENGIYITITTNYYDP